MFAVGVDFALPILLTNFTTAPDLLRVDYSRQRPHRAAHRNEDLWISEPRELGRTKRKAKLDLNAGSTKVATNKNISLFRAAFRGESPEASELVLELVSIGKAASSIFIA